MQKGLDPRALAWALPWCLRATWSTPHWISKNARSRRVVSFQTVTMKSLHERLELWVLLNDMLLMYWIKLLDILTKMLIIFCLSEHKLCPYTEAQAISFLIVSTSTTASSTPAQKYPARTKLANTHFCSAQPQNSIWHSWFDFFIFMFVIFFANFVLHFSIQLVPAEYLIVLTGRERRGRLMGQEVYRATDFDILPLKTDISVLYPPHPVEGHLLALVRSHLNAGFFLFSYGWDVTTRLQAQWVAQESTQRQALWEAACHTFSRTCSSLTIIVGRW